MSDKIITEQPVWKDVISEHLNPNDQSKVFRLVDNTSKYYNNIFLLDDYQTVIALMNAMKESFVDKINNMHIHNENLRNYILGALNTVHKKYYRLMCFYFALRKNECVKINPWDKNVIYRILGDTKRNKTNYTLISPPVTIKKLLSKNFTVRVQSPGGEIVEVKAYNLRALLKD